MTEQEFNQIEQYLTDIGFDGHYSNSFEETEWMSNKHADVIYTGVSSHGFYVIRAYPLEKEIDINSFDELKKYI